MKVRLKIKISRITAFAIALLVFFLPLKAFAAPTIDMSRLGSITINVSDVYGPISGIEFSVYKFADLSSSGVYTLTSDFSGSGVSLRNLSTAAEASIVSKTLAGYAAANGISGSADITDPSGIVTFENLALGYYLVVQTVTSASTSSHSISDPFLLSVPMTNSAGSSWVYDYDIVAYPKSEPCFEEYGAVILEKVNGEGEVLSGAVFCLEKKVYYITGASVPKGAESGSDSAGNYYWGAYISVLTTNDYGQIAVNSLTYGQYRFVETSAPSGYILDSKPNDFSVIASGSVILSDGKYIKNMGNVQVITVLNLTTESVPSTEASDSNSQPPSQTLPTTDVPDDDVNTDNFILPQTGGSIAYAVCTYGGIVLVICGVVVFIASRKKRGKK